MINSSSLRKEYKEKRRILRLTEPLPEDAFKGDCLHGAFVVASCMLLAGILLIGSCKAAHADEIKESDAIKAIIGEAENQGEQGMLAVAGAIRNRGTLKGVYGLRAPRVKKHLYSKETFFLAQRAWAISATVDITKGADHWENIKAFGCPKWVKSCIETFRYKDHVFYKEIV